MKLFRKPDVEPKEQVAVEAVVTPPPPADPVELGLRLRSARERLGLRLEDVRDEIDVPLVDLDALERGNLEPLHTQQAAVVALWRYAERLGLEPRELAGVINAHWPHRGLAVNAVASRRGYTPVAELRTAIQLLNPISDPISLGATRLGLSETTRGVLEDHSAKRLVALQLLAPVTAAPLLSRRPAPALPEHEDRPPGLAAGAPAPGEARLYENPISGESEQPSADTRALEEFLVATAGADQPGPADSGLQLDELAGDDNPEAQLEVDAPFDQALANVELTVDDPGPPTPQGASIESTATAPSVAQAPNDGAGSLSDARPGPDDPAAADPEPTVRAEAPPADAPDETTAPASHGETLGAPWDSAALEGDGGTAGVPRTTTIPVVPTVPLGAPAGSPVGAEVSSSLLPNLTVMLGNADRPSRWLRGVGRRLAERFGLMPEDDTVRTPEA